METGDKIIRGFNKTRARERASRVYEYAGAETIAKCRDQLEALFWLCSDAEGVVVANGMDLADARTESSGIEKGSPRQATSTSTAVKSRCQMPKVILICPLCLQELSAQGFFSRMEQAEDRLTRSYDNAIEPFHIAERSFWRAQRSLISRMGSSSLQCCRERLESSRRLSGCVMFSLRYRGWSRSSGEKRS